MPRIQTVAVCGLGQTGAAVAFHLLDLIERIHLYLLNDIADNHGPFKLLTQCVREQHPGMKTGRGFYDWKTRSGSELIDRRDKQIVRQLDYLKEPDEQQDDT